MKRTDLLYGQSRALLVASLLAVFTALAPMGALAQSKKPNILVIWGDDIGIPQISGYTRGLMGYQTPNIDRIAQGRRMTC